MARKQDMEAMLNGFEAEATREHDAKVAAANGSMANGRATSLVSMSAEEKERFTNAAKRYGLSLSAFFRRAANEYMTNHDR